ncbi:integral membrane protein [Rhypophila decipiens]|uniref:Integral membrane protein n=1 Tax=Rhypophila decipiens TaxID=261697 RepID=A0AAN6YBN9_9PEZI|nr:integral membrane protein [Rhypophila decipiens]
MISLARPLFRALTVGAAVGMGLVPSVLAHGGDNNTDDMKMGETDKPLPEDQYPPTYFALGDHRAAIYSHIGLMVLAWVFVLPVAVMLSLARSRHRITAQLVFLAVNGGGVLLGTIYNASTPDLYPNNAHHTLGWVVTWIVCSQVAIGLLSSIAGVFKRGSSELRNAQTGERQSFIPVSTEAIAEHESSYPKPHRFSDDSGQGTEVNTESLGSGQSHADPGSPLFPPTHGFESGYHEGYADDNIHSELPRVSKLSGAVRSVVERIANKVSSRAWKVLMLAYNFVDRTILVLGSVTLATGIITFGRFFEGNEIFSGLAHWIKGGIFFWLGIFTLGRWAGSFGDLGWAWNVRPKQRGRKWRPSAEFVESALIFIYGSTNIFLEHLGNWGGEYSAQDLEHISITVLFIGGGLCGMLIESVRIRDLLNTTVEEAGHFDPEKVYNDEGSRDETQEPDTYAFSMNPIPALVILLLGIMMSSHTQHNMISSMVHKQWGNLLTGASFARGFTYVLTYLKPPKSIYPSRPPTELLTAFGLISGGIIFMASSSDTINGMVHYELDAMFMFTVTMGLVGLLMAWIILVVALKGWAVRREARAAYAKA